MAKLSQKLRLSGTLEVLDFDKLVKEIESLETDIDSLNNIINDKRIQVTYLETDVRALRDKLHQISNIIN